MADSQMVEHQTKILKRALYNWRIVLILLKSVLMWEQQWHPFAIFGVVSFLYLLNWLINLSYITTFAILGLLINFLDCTISIICNIIFGEDSWNEEKEKIYEDICKATVHYYNNLLNIIDAFTSFREYNPIKYLVITNSALWALAWISYNMNNELLLYVITLGILLSPGSKHIKPRILSLIHSMKTEKKE